ncbi:hypothetical protein CDL15_Pgr008829 [Punica granatum]|uniref:UDP-glycosyltransferase 83A1-like n=1 Tax=Punica granatum TaxID=22663 RepID=A0A218VY81_PUNGR|nr:hypothetical protein CDL15_Pgr008829 [Punica granatum]PKI47753.1 hypothetical protein CRG98_031886 [Punica granatum]
MGLELSGRPFLWVVRSDILDGQMESVRYLDGFLDRVASRGKMVSYVPQEKVLSHPSAACFLTHCGWNSTLEGLSYGVRFLCWPYLADQFYIQNYICDVLEVGLSLQIEDSSGVLSRHEIVQPLKKLISNTRLKENAEKIKAMAQKSVSQGGTSYWNLRYFVKQLKNC